MQHRSKVENPLHITWATYRRHPFLTPDVEPRVHGCIVGELKRLGCTLLAIGGVEDHVHLVILLPSTVALAKVMQRVKGVSSKMAGEVIGPLAGFKWQEGFSAFGLCRPYLNAATHYVRRQKQRHA
ncbi:MAG: transposase [Armatimonadetes bacterium]|nr:transposase [Armatimonadota bacterium]